ncbi:MAG: replication initiation protein [Campylobacterota bacterium]|nr:replication initiation protein [Campylobacterota bacterium]
MNNKNIIKTSHELNHFKGGYTKLELDFIYAFISTIKDEDEKFNNYQLTLKELEKKLGRRLELSKIEYIFDNLIKKTFKINDKNEIAVYSFFTYLSFDKKTKILTVDFNERLKYHLIQLNKYAKGNFKYLLRFKSEYSKRIYMLISQWKNIKLKKYTVIELREILEIPASYPYSNFKRKALLVAEKELKKNSDVFFEFEEVKQGRKVIEIIFHIYVGGGTDKTVIEPTYNYYKKKTVYFNGRDWIILNVSSSKSKGYVDVQLMDEDFNTIIEHLHFTSLKNMVEYKLNKK